MEVSTFELLFKQQSPVIPNGVLNVQKVIQGYFLTISNLENQAYTYALDLTIFPPPDGTLNRAYRTLLGKTVFVFDAAGTDNQFGVVQPYSPVGIGQGRFRTPNFQIPARGTALVLIIPNAFPCGSVTEPLMEVRGYATLRLPALLRFRPGFQPIYRAQSTQPVDVLVTPQHRATFFDAAGGVTDQIQASLPTASGSARNQVVPDPDGPFTLFPPFPIPSFPIDLFSFLTETPDSIAPALVGSVLSEIGVDQDQLAKLNAQLAEAKLPFVIQNRQVEG